MVVHVNREGVKVFFLRGVYCSIVLIWLSFFFFLVSLRRVSCRPLCAVESPALSRLSMVQPRKARMKYIANMSRSMLLLELEKLLVPFLGFALDYSHFNSSPTVGGSAASKQWQSVTCTPVKVLPAFGDRQLCGSETTSSSKTFNPNEHHRFPKWSIIADHQGRRRPMYNVRNA